MRALLLERPGSLRVGEVERYDAPDDWVSIVPSVVGLCGTDLHAYEGHLPVPYPLALGHEIAGIAETGELAGQLVMIDPVEGCGACPTCQSGRENICPDVRVVGLDRDGGLAERLHIAPERVYGVPQGVSAELAAAAEPLAVAVHAVDRGGVCEGDVVAVFGGGPIGLLTAIAARHCGATRVVISEPAGARRKLAAQLGFEAVDPADGPAALSDAVGPDRARVAFDAAGHPSLPPTLTGVVRSGGVVVVIGAYQGTHPVDLADLVAREIAVLGTRALTRKDNAAALALTARRASELSLLIDGVVSVGDTGPALERLRRGEAIKLLVDCSGLTG